MYKIYVNENVLMLVNREKALAMREEKNYLFAPYSGKRKMLLSYMDMLEKSNKLSRVVIFHFDLDRLKEDFESLFTVVKASGGLVRNENDEILGIFRRGHWDLPKGKIEPGESKKEAAIREVSEETGTKGLKIIRKLKKTRHFYRTRNGNRAIKLSYWYLMETKKQKLTPQQDEDIEKARWMTLNAFLETEEPIYSSIKKVLKRFRRNSAEAKMG